ncbi:MAG: hypothetical protein Kow006_06180 [Gammaproteobacteria bacterium]
MLAANFFTAATPSAAYPVAPVLPRLERGKVLIYSTPGCFFCGKAKSYMKRNGISYREIDITSSATAQREFFAYGGKGVPLIMVGTRSGTQRLHGFNETLFKSIYASR